MILLDFVLIKNQYYEDTVDLGNIRHYLRWTSFVNFSDVPENVIVFHHSLIYADYYFFDDRQ